MAFVAFRVVNNLTGVSFVSNDLRRALQIVLADHTDDRHVAAAIDTLADATTRGDESLATMWAIALHVTITKA